MTVRELLEAVDREAERALIGYRLDLDAEVEVKGTISVYRGEGMMMHDQNIEARAVRFERVGSRVFLVIE